MTREISGKRMTRQLLERRKERLRKGNWPISKWIIFCEEMLRHGFEVYCYEAFSTRSKYVYVCRGEKTFKVRFSNHRPSYLKEAELDSDFYVGVSHSSITTTEDAILVVHQFFREELAHESVRSL